MTQDFVDLYLESKGLKRMIVGHNEQKEITPAYEGKVITTDVEIDESGNSAEGLLISGDEISICHADGSRERIP